MQELWERDPITERILRTAGSIPVNTRSARIIESNYYWLQRLRDIGIHVHNRTVDARTLYHYITTTQSLEAATEAACKDANTQIVEELRLHTHSFSPLHCGAIARNSSMLVAMAGDLNSSSAACQVLTHPSIPYSYKEVVLPLLDRKQIEQCLHTINDPHVLALLDSNHFILPVTAITKANVPHTLSTIEPTPEQVRLWARAAINEGFIDNLRILLPRITDTQPFIQLASAKGNAEAVRLLVTPVTGSLALMEAIKHNHPDVVSILRTYSTPLHIRAARSTPVIYNLLVS